MLFSMYYLQDGKAKLESLASLCKGNSDINNIKAKVLAVMSDMVFAFEELAFTTDSYEYMRKKDNLTSIRKTVQNVEELEQLKQALESYIQSDLDNIAFNAASSYNFKRSSSRYVNSFFDTSNYTLKELSKIFNVPKREIQILDARCSYGNNLYNFAESFEKKITYGIEIDQDIAKSARQKINRVAAGGLAGSRITNDCFDILMLHPMISWEAPFIGNQNPCTNKKEKVFLNNVIKYLRTDGVLIFTIPYFRLYKDLCLLIAKNFNHIQVKKTDDFNDYGTVVITGRKNLNNKDIDETIYHYLRTLHDQSKIDNYVSKPFEQYTLPNQKIEVEMFRGSILDSNELLGIVSSSGCINDFWNKQKVEKLSESTIQPLLPFNIGQIGLVLTSGCLDGVIDEGDGYYHLIKGKVSKKSEIEKNYNSDNELETQETILNRVEINVILPNGEFKVLA